MKDFATMGLKSDLLKMIDEKGFQTPTPIQAQSIPLAMEGRDIMGQAQTGTGKTASFGIPILNKTEKGQGIQALIVCPTRELAVQVAEEISFLGRRMHINVLAVYGGQSIEIQFRGLKKRPEIIVGTPGRLLDHMGRHTLNLSKLKFLVLDEADEMLDMGFLPDIEKILVKCPPERQTFLFSATLLDEVRKLGTKFMNKPQLILIESPERTIPITEQRYYEVNPRKKIETLVYILEIEQPEVTLIFCRTKKSVDKLAKKLNYSGYSVDALHGDMSQRERDFVMNRFRKGGISILVATDLAARGLDINLVTHVVNYDIPEDRDAYIHRIGRTGRAGRSGVAITLVEPSQRKQLRIIEQYIGKKVRREVLPDLVDSIEIRQGQLLNRLLKAAEEPLPIYEDVAKKWLETYDSRLLLTAALKLLLDSGSPELAPMEADTAISASVHMELPAGRFQGIQSRKLVEFLTANTSLNPQQIGDIEINSNSTYVEVPMDSVEEVSAAFCFLERNRTLEPKRSSLGKRSKKPNVSYRGSNA